MKLARAAYARVLIIPHSVSVEHRADQWIIFFFFKFAKGRSLSLFHQCKAWSSADRRHTRSESALVVGVQLLLGTLSRLFYSFSLLMTYLKVHALIT